MKKSKLFLSVAAFMLCASTAISAVTEVFETISVQLRPDIEIYVNGEALDMKDTNGNDVSPIVYEGTTYVPLRTAAEIAGTNVYWDGNNTDINLVSTNIDDQIQRINLADAALEVAQLDAYFSNLEYPQNFSFNTFEFSDKILTIYLNQSDEETWSTVFESITLSIYNKFSGIESVIFEIPLPYDTITKEYDYDWYLNQRN